MTDRERRNVMLMANLRANGLEFRVRVTDISKGGVKVRAAPTGPVASQVTLELPGLGWISARVAWIRAETFGLQFHRAIDPAAVRQAVTGTYVRPPPPPPRLLRRVA